MDIKRLNLSCEQSSSIPFRNLLTPTYYLLLPLQVLERLVKKAKEEQQTLVLFHAPASILPALEAVPGLEQRALKTTTPSAALVAVRYKSEGEGKPLLEREHEDGQA